MIRVIVWSTVGTAVGVILGGYQTYSSVGTLGHGALGLLIGTGIGFFANKLGPTSGAKR